MKKLSFLLPSVVLAALAVACGRAEGVASRPLMPPHDAGSFDAEPEPVFKKVACGETLPGVALQADLIEAQPGFADELAAVDLTLAPDPFDYSSESRSMQALINYMLGRAETSPLAHKDAITGMAKSVLAGAARRTSNGLDLVFMRRGFHHFYLCERNLPVSLAELERRYGSYLTWERVDIACARPKDGPRRIWRNPEGTIHVAETIEGNEVRETEVLYVGGGRPDGQLDFAVYTPDGDITDRSTFATAGGTPNVLAAPITCMACHSKVESNRIIYSETFPDGTGAGCR